MLDGLLFGRHPVAELLRAGGAVRRLWLAEAHLRGRGNEFWQQLAEQAEASGAEVRPASAAQLSALVGDVVHQGAVAEAAPFAYAALESLLPPPQSGAPAPMLLVLDQVQDPHNLGALTRSAAALGATGVVVGKDRSAQMTPAAIKASAGAAYHVPVAQVVNVARALETMRKSGLWTVGLDLAGTDRLSSVDLRGPLALVVGAEGAGLRPLVARGCDFRVRLPLVRIGSLNASVAGALAMYEVARTRAAAPPGAKRQTSA